MPVSNAIREGISKGSMIRAMFEAGIAMAKERGADKVFDFSLGNPDIEPPKAFIDELIKTATSKELGLHGYMTNAGYNFTCSAMAEKVSLEHNIKATAKDIVMTVGAAGALNVIFKTITNPGDEVIIIAPFFAEYKAYIGNAGGVPRIVESNPDFSLNLKAIEDALSPKTTAIIINSPNNPTGRVYPAKDLDALADILRNHGKKCGRLPYIVADEPYRDIIYDGLTVPPLLCHYSESIVASSFSKSLSIPGERMGYIGVNPDCEDKETLLAGLTMCNRQLGFVNAPAIIQRAVTNSWKSKAEVERYAKRRDMLMDVMNKSGIEYAKPEGAFYLFVKVPTGHKASLNGKPSDICFADYLKEQGVLAVPGTGFGKSDWLRLCYCVPEEKIQNSLPYVKKAVENWKNS